MRFPTISKLQNISPCINSFVSIEYTHCSTISERQITLILLIPFLLRYIHTYVQHIFCFLVSESPKLKFIHFDKLQLAYFKSLNDLLQKCIKRFQTKTTLLTTYKQIHTYLNHLFEEEILLKVLLFLHSIEVKSNWSYLCFSFEMNFNQKEGRRPRRNENSNTRKSGSKQQSVKAGRRKFKISGQTTAF